METTYSRSASVEATPLESECILFHNEANKFFVLNGTASFIWSRLEQASTVDDIARELRRSYRGVTEQRADEDVRRTLEQMLELAVVETQAS